MCHAWCFVNRPLVVLLVLVARRFCVARLPPLGASACCAGGGCGRFALITLPKFCPVSVSPATPLPILPTPCGSGAGGGGKSPKSSGSISAPCLAGISLVVVVVCVLAGISGVPSCNTSPCLAGDTSCVTSVVFAGISGACCDANNGCGSVVPVCISCVMFSTSGGLLKLAGFLVVPNRGLKMSDSFC